MDLASTSNQGSLDNTAYKVKMDKPPKECSWCQKQGYFYKGHVWKNCRKLKAFKEKEKKKDDKGNLATTSEATAFLANMTPSNCHYNWVFNTGATTHMTADKALFEELQPHSGHVTFADGQKRPVQGIGSITLPVVLSNGTTSSITLKNVLYVPSLGPTNLLSWTKAEEAGLTLMVKPSQFIIKNVGKEVALFKKMDGEYILQQPQLKANAATFQEWHERLGHISPTSYKHLPSSFGLPPLPTTFSCSTCDLSKSQKTSRPSITYKPSKPLLLIHSDLSGKFSIPSLSKAYYYITFIDDHSRFAWVYFLNKKSDTTKAIKHFIKMIERQTGHKIRRFRTDNGTEYVNQFLKESFTTEGIIHDTTAPYSPQSNGVAERFNQTIATMARCILKDLPTSLWAEAIAWSVYTKNRLPHSTISFKTPYEVFYGQQPSLDHLRSFGTPCIVHIMPEE